MKRKSCMFLAVLLVMVQLIGVFAILPASAASLGRNYEIYKCDSDITIDGNPTEWDSALWSEKFSKVNTVGNYTATVGGRFKAMWKESATDGMIDLYVLIKVDYEASLNASLDTFKVRADVNGKPYETGSKNRKVAGLTTDSAKGCSFAATLTGTDNFTEICLTIPKGDSDTISLSVGIQDGNGWTSYNHYTWNGEGLGGVGGACTLKDEVRAYGNCAYDIQKTTAEISVDGQDAEWDHVAWSRTFIHGGANESGKVAMNANIEAAYKALWKESATAGKMDVYVLVKLENGWTGSVSTPCQVKMNVNGTSYVTGGMQMYNGTRTESAYEGKSVKLGDGSGVLEVVYRGVSIPQNGTIAMNVMVLEYASDYASFRAYTWTGGDANDLSGTATINNEINPLVGVRVAATDGASIRLDTEAPEKSGIRFATTVTVPANAKLIKTGTLIVPTAHLAKTSEFTLEALNAAGLVENKNFYNIVNAENEWVDGLDGTWYGSLINIQATNYGRAISGIGYAVIEVEGVEYTVYAAYDSAKHSRSIEQIAQTLLDNNYYEAGSPEALLLQTFVATGANES